MGFDRRSNFKKLADVLTHEGILSKTQVTEAQKYQRHPQEPLAPHVIRCGFITSWDLAKVVCMNFSLPYFDLVNFSPKKDVVAMLDPAVLHGYGIFPIDVFGKAITLAVAEPLSPDVLQTVVDKTQKSPFLYVSPYDIIRNKLEEFAPYAAPDAPAPAPSSSSAEPEESDWMSIFEEAEKKMKGEDDEEEDDDENS